MFLQGRTYSQNSFDLLGGITNIRNSHFKLNGFESNVSNYSGIKDWEFSVIYGGEISGGFHGNVYDLAFSKRIGEHSFFFRYTPGYQKDFASTSKYLSLPDKIPTLLKSTFHYEERLGLGYSYTFKKDISVGFSFRYFRQEFSRDEVETFFEPYISISTSNIKAAHDLYIGDIGINYLWTDGLNLSASTINLFKNTINSSSQNEPYLLKTDLALRLGVDYQMNNALNAKFIYETNNSFQFGPNYGFDFLGGSLNFSLEAFHDKYQDPFIAGIIPGINFSGKYFGITVSGAKYFSARTSKISETIFASEGLYNIINNRYSSDKIFAAFNFALNTVKERNIRLLDVKIERNIFPLLSDYYLDVPFAKGTIVNLTEKNLIVKPSSIIKELNKETVFSPEVFVAPHDTAVVSFFTIINDEASIKKTFIAQAAFYLNTEDSDPDDEMNKPILVNDVNSWDGNVSNLRHFVRKDFDKVFNYSKKIVSDNKAILDTLPSVLESFYLTKVMFNSFARQMVYVADPRASVDRVQFPLETLEIKGGDCDDLSVAFSALLESIGIQTAFVDYKSESGVNHVSVMVNMHLSPAMASLITVNDKKYFLRKNEDGKDEVWIPIETTFLKDFDSAWGIASERFYNEAVDNMGLVKGRIQIVDVY